jgi:hypothetical protein
MRSRSESLALFPNLEPEQAMALDAKLRDLTHGLLRDLIGAFPELDANALTVAAGKAEKTLAMAMSDLMSGAQPTDNEPSGDSGEIDPVDSGMPVDDPAAAPPQESRAGRLLRQMGRQE